MEQDDRYVAEQADRAQHREAVDARQVDVEQHGIDIAAVERAKALLAGRCLGDLEPVADQVFAYDAPHVGLVVGRDVVDVAFVDEAASGDGEANRMVADCRTATLVAPHAADDVVASR